MQVNGTTFGIIPDTFATILSNYLTPLQNTFPNANSINDPIYALAYVSATMDQLNEAALSSLWNAINAQTAQGLGLDILANTVLNLERPGLIPSSCAIQVTIGNIYSVCQIQMTVSGVGGSPPYTVPIGWTASGGVTTLASYQTLTSSAISTTGVYYFNVYSTDTSTSVPASNFTSGSTVSGLTYTLTNPASATLGSLTVPTTWAVTASSLGTNTPSYYLNTAQTVSSAGTYNWIVYSQNITTPINATQLNTFSSNFSNGALSSSAITSVNNQYAAILGVPAPTDAQFQAERRYYLNVEGQTYYGLEKAIIDLEVPALQSVFIAETISNSNSDSTLIIQAAITASQSSPVVIPEGWTVLGSATPSPNYATLLPYTFTTSGTYYIPTYSTDDSTNVGIGTISSASPVVTGVGAITNLDPAILSTSIPPNGLGQRGYTVYLAYPTINPESFCNVNLVVSSVGSSTPYIIPVGWTASGGVTTVAPYETTQTYSISSSGTYAITVYSTDLTTSVPANNFSSGSTVSGLTISSVSNPTAGTLGGGFNVNDLYLQSIASTCYAYHPLGTQFYSGGVGATTFTVNTPYSGYTYNVILNPFQTTQVSVNLEIVYNADPADAGFSNGVFNTALLPTLQTTVLELINTYFLSKTLPTDLVYSINELSEIIQNTFTGIVALVGNSGAQFSFGTISPSVTGLLYLRRPIGYNYQLSNSNFTFSAVNKDTLPS